MRRVVLVVVGAKEARVLLSKYRLHLGISVSSLRPSHAHILNTNLLTIDMTGTVGGVLRALFSLGHSPFCLPSPSLSGNTGSLSVNQHNARANKRKLVTKAWLVPCLISLSAFPSAHLASAAVTCSLIETRTAEAAAAAAAARRERPTHQLQVAHQAQHQN